MTVGDRIREARKEAGLTQAQLAAESSVATITIHQYESGKRQPRVEQLQAIASALNVPVSYFLEADPTEKDIIDTTGRVLSRTQSKLRKAKQEGSSPEEIAGLEKLHEELGEVLEDYISDAVSDVSPKNEDIKKPTEAITFDAAPDPEYTALLHQNDVEANKPKRYEPDPFKVGDSYYGGALRVSKVEDLADGRFSVTFQADENGMTAEELRGLFDMLKTMSTESGVSIEGLAQLARVVQTVAAKESAQESPQDPPENK